MYANALNNDKAASYAEQPSQLFEPRLNQGSDNYPQSELKISEANAGAKLPEYTAASQWT